MLTESKKQRKIYFDLIRILAIFLVLFTHTHEVGSKLYMLREGDFVRLFYIVLDCFRTINNPLLFMVSGALLLGRDESIGQVWKKRIFRFVIVLFVFSYIHLIDTAINSGTVASFDFLASFRSIIEGPVRSSYWFLYSYISFLIMLPLLRLVAKHMTLKDGVYLFLTGVVVLDGFRLFRLCTGVSGVNLTVYFCEMIMFYPLIGFVMEKYWDEITAKIDKNKMIIATLLGITGLMISAGLTYREYLITGNWTENWITFSDPLLAAVLFIGVKHFCGNIAQDKHPVFVRVVTVAGGSMFGIYLLENILRNITKPVFYALDAFTPTIVACLIWLMLTMVLGTVVIWLIKLIPGVKKYI
ncbi:MAG: acyltransferase [Lachnospiraceae bacterium]|nr:acyltransferase [Lachnospiraceae bacterium]